MSGFAEVICKNIDQLADAAHRSHDQSYVDQYLDTFFAISERCEGRSGLAHRPKSAASILIQGRAG